MVTPRYFPLSTTSSCCPWSMYDVSIGLRLLEIRITILFFRWKHICQCTTGEVSSDLYTVPSIHTAGFWFSCTLSSHQRTYGHLMQCSHESHWCMLGTAEVGGQSPVVLRRERQEWVKCVCLGLLTGLCLSGNPVSSIAWCLWLHGVPSSVAGVGEGPYRRP
jgi:hypothetical protein